jgi:flagellar basal body-associated protein FliL
LCQSALAYVLVTRFIIPQRRAAMGLDDEESTETVARAVREIVAINVPLVYRLEEILVNPTDESEIRYLNVLMTFEVDNEEVLVELKDKLVASRVRDLVVRTLGNTPVTEMDTTEKRQAIKAAIQKRVNESELLTTGEITGILFERFILH